MHKPLVLVVEDDKAVRNLLTTALDVNGYTCRSAETGMQSIQEALSYKPDIILLDLGLPDMDGMELLKKIRSWSNVPILVVSARDEDKDKIEAFDTGADDYVTKPFSVDELMARLRASLRRAYATSVASPEGDRIFRNGELCIDYATGRAFFVRNGAEQELHLTPIEYKLLCMLARHVGKVLTHQFLFKEIWGRTTDKDASHLRVFMASLRKKIEGNDNNSAQYFQTHMGIGYRMIHIGLCVDKV